MTDRLRTASWAMLIAPLAFFYFYFIAWSVKSGAVPPKNEIEAIVLAAMMLRLTVVMSVKRLRSGKIWQIIDIFALEVLVIAGMLVVYVLTREPVYLSTLAAIAYAWPGALLLVFPAYGLYKFSVALVERASVYTVIPTAIGLFSMLLIPAEVATMATSVQGLSSISLLLLKVIIGQATSAVLGPEAMFAGFLIFLALTFYVTTQDEGADARWPALVIAAIGSVLALGWSELGSIFTDDLLLLFAVPGLAIIGLVWWVTRGH
jgi:hypothetical protein